MNNENSVGGLTFERVGLVVKGSTVIVSTIFFWALKRIYKILMVSATQDIQYLKHDQCVKTGCISVIHDICFKVSYLTNLNTFYRCF
jgi:hypothetical protein